jgi:hypothetical protein
VPALTVATPVLSLLHAPPAVALLNAVVEPAHVARLPVMPDAETVITFVAVSIPQLLVTMYNIVTVPPDTPVTVPLVTVA